MNGRGRSQQRTSVKSKDSRGSSTLTESDVDTREKIKDCCRKTIAFMCSCVGVACLVLAYTLIGAVSFMKIELLGNNTEYNEARRLRKEYAVKLWVIAKENNVFNRSAFTYDTDLKLLEFQKQIVELIKVGYDGRTLAEMWTFPGALMFALNTISMVGYGNIVPRTSYGRLTTVIYAVFGIPLFIVYFLNVGKALAGVFRWFYNWLFQCSTEHDEHELPRRVLVPSSASVWVIGAYILAGTIMFAEWEKWSYLDSCYFCFTSLCKLGLGDLVPGNISTKSGSQVRLVMNYIFILLGLGIMSMCYHLTREEVRVKVKEMKEDFAQCMADTKLRFSNCYQKCCGSKKKRHRERRAEFEY